jgi:hypothetical protein
MSDRGIYDTAMPQTDHRNWARGEWHEAARILHRANPDWPCSRIAEVLGVTKSAVYKVLHPDRAREYNRRGNSGLERQEAKNRHTREWSRRPENRGRCANPCCGNLRGVRAVRVRPEGHCEECWHAIADVRRTLSEGMWADGWTLREMAEAVGVTKCYFSVRRARDGWDLPQRVRTGWSYWGNQSLGTAEMAA